MRRPVQHAMKTALFLGAGASAFIRHPTAKGLMESLRNRVRDDEAGSMGEATKRIIECYDDIEKLYDGIDRMLGMRDAVHDDTRHDAPNIRPIIRTLYDGDDSFKATLDELESLKSVIHDILLESFKDVGDIKSIASMYGMVRRVIKDDESDGLQVFTTNYDGVIEEYARETGFEIINGFEYRRTMDHVWVGEWEARTNKKPLYLTKLHGSVSWYKDDDGNLREAKDVTQRPADRSVMIAPTEGPKDYGRKPFPELKSHFEDEMKDVKVLLVIGFSYRDEYIVDVIKKNLDRGMKLISVSPTTEKDMAPMETRFPLTTPVDDQLFVSNHRVFLIDKKFELETINHMRVWLNGGFDHARRYSPKGNAA